jgi:hypothetical protein
VVERKVTQIRQVLVMDGRTGADADADAGGAGREGRPTRPAGWAAGQAWSVASGSGGAGWPLAGSLWADSV